MADKLTAPKTTGLNSKQSLHPPSAPTGKKSQPNNQPTDRKKSEESHKTKKMGEHPSLAPTGDSSSGIQSRLPTTVGPGITSTRPFSGNPYLSNKNNTPQNAQVLQQLVKKALPQARHEPILTHQPYIPLKTQSQTPIAQINSSIVNQRDANKHTALPPVTTVQPVQTNCEQNQNDQSRVSFSLPFDSSTQQKRQDLRPCHSIPPDMRSPLVPNMEQTYLSHVVSTEHVNVLSSKDTSNGNVPNKRKNFPPSVNVNKNPLSKKNVSNGKSSPLTVPTGKTQPFPNPLHMNGLDKIHQAPTSNANNVKIGGDQVKSTHSKAQTMDGQIKKKETSESTAVIKPGSDTKQALESKPLSPPAPEPPPEKPLTEEDKKRMELLNTYGPYLIPSDTSLNAARARLRQALEQTRHLRVSFSDRVYNKYRILLRPVPKTVDEIIEPIKRNPGEAKQKIVEKIKLIKDEKDAEKKEIPKRAAIISNSLLSGEQIFGVPSSASAMNIAESEQLFSAGLSLVILPEEEIDENEINLDEYEHRGPTDPETGQRLGGISSAAAAAAEALLDRTRRSVASRMERRRRSMLSAMKGEKDGSLPSDLEFFSLNQLSSSTSDALPKSALSVDKALGLSQSFMKPKTGEKPHASLQKPTKRHISGKGTGSSNSSNWNKKRISKSIAVGNVNGLLSISPNVEGKSRAAAFAVHSLCPKLMGSGGRSSNQHSFRAKLNQHPHPDSKGGISFMASLGNSSSRKNSLPANNSSLHLPRLVYPYKRKRNECVSVLPPNTAAKDSAIKAVGIVLDQFFCSPEPIEDKKNSLEKSQSECTGSNDKKISSDANNEEGRTENGNTIEEPLLGEKGSAQTRKRRRKVTEIGLLRGLRNLECSTWETNQTTNLERTDLSEIKKSESFEKKINPILAFSVLHALGIVSSSKGAVPNLDKKLPFVSLMPDEKIEFESESFSDYVFDRWRNLVKEKGIPPKKLEKQGVEISFQTSNENVNQVRPKHEHIELKESQKEKKIDEVISISPISSISSKKEVKIIKQEASNEKQIQPEVKNILDPKKNKQSNSTQESFPVVSTISPVVTNQVTKVGQEKNNLPQHRGWDPMSARRGDIPHRPQQQALSNQHHVPPQFLARLQAPGIQPNYSVLSQAGNVSSAFNSSPQTLGRTGLPQIDQRLNHNSPHLLNNHHRAPHLNQVSYGDALNHNATSPVLTNDYFHGNNHMHQQQHNRAYGSTTEWSSLGLLSASPTMMGGIDLSATQAHAMIGHSAQALHHHHFAAAVRSNLNNIASISAQQANLLLNNGRVPNGNSFQQQRIQQFNGRAQMQANEEVSMMTSAGLLMTGQRPLGESFPTLSPTQAQAQAQVQAQAQSQAAQGQTRPQPQSLMYLNNPNDSTSQLMKRSASAGVPSDPTKTQPSLTALPAIQVSKDKTLQKPLEEIPLKENVVGKVQQNIPSKSDKSLEKKTDLSCLEDSSQTVPKKTQPSYVPPKLPTKDTEVSESHRKQKVTMQITSNQSVLPDSIPITGGMRFFVPPSPPGLGNDAAEMILKGCIHKISLNEDKSKALEYLVLVGTAIPIPRALISNPLKDRFAVLSKAAGNPCPCIPKDVIGATITTWLWAEHSDCFQRAFAKSGRIDVDPECKWLITLAIDTSLRALLTDITVKAKGSGRDVKYEFSVVTLVCQTLMREMNVNDKNDIASPNLKYLIAMLDHRRLEALKLMCQERVLIATLVSRYTKMSEQFANAYVSAMVRSGEALGHEDLCEIVQDESTCSCTMLPYDILSDVTGGWDDPCRPSCGFSADLNADELTKRSHARAQLHKSLFKLQDKFDIKGGVSTIGPYSESSSSGDTGGSSGNQSGSVSSTVSRGVNGNLKRRQINDSVKAHGTHFNNSSVMARFNPLHYSLPLLWDSVAMENMPYGRYVVGGKKGKRTSGNCNTNNQNRQKKVRLSTSPQKENARRVTKMKSTEAIDWSDVAKHFQPVAVGVKPFSTTPVKKSPEESCTHIFAPVFHELKVDPVVPGAGWSDSDDSDEEDITDQAVLARHQSVLDSMKHKLDAALEAKQKSRKSI